jgi:hypothetical protein
MKSGYDTRKYHRYLHSPEWKLKRQEAFKIHGKICKTCGATERLEINHKHYRNIFNESVADDLEVLCHYCHCVYHGMNPDRMPRLTKKERKQLKRQHIPGNPIAITMEQYRARAASGTHKSTMIE